MPVHISARLQLFILKEQVSFVGNEGKGSSPRSLGNEDVQYCGPGSSVVIATDYGLEGPGIESGEGPIIWNWTRAKLGLILRMDPPHISRTWPLRPDFHYWPPQRQTALIWILEHLVYYRIQTHRRLSLRDFMDFLKRARWKAHFRKGQIPNTGRYLELL
jgi:hypothetical protein